MKNLLNTLKRSASRRTFLKKGLGTASVGAGLLSSGSVVLGQATITTGDAAILRFLAAAEILETDLWIQYTRRNTG